MVRPFASFQRKIESQLGVKLHLKINDNRSTMLSVRWEPDCTKVSLHRIFLNAPDNVMEALVCYLRKQHKKIAPSIKAFIDDSVKQMDYSYQIDQTKLITQGTYYNLKELYDQVNQKYFNGELNLLITWFGKPVVKSKNKVTFGLYYDTLKLIKINRLLDSPQVPDYFLSYVIYHECLHKMYPSYVDKKGMSKIHTAEFKEKEAEFEHFKLVKKLIKEEQTLFFSRC
ncbi:MAG: hypothetical protein BGO10_07325 [Chlamydia sp. 32-24]|nr:MAG: hypothetical protein BGO10_07325 [Chlamydia sp. 32-24]